jgi:hypothetical protein
MAHEDLDRSLGAHHRDLGRRPGDDQVRLVRAAAHDVVARAVRLAHDDGELGDRRVGGREQHLGAVADDPRLLDPGADHEPGHVDEVHERDPERVAEVDEARGLVGGVVVEDPTEVARLVGDDPGGPAAEARQAGDDRPRPASLEVEPRAVVDDPADDLVHVVGGPGRRRQHVEQVLVRALHRIGTRTHRRRLVAVCREVGQIPADRLDAVPVVGGLEVADARAPAVHAGAAELLGAHLLADRRAHEVRARERHRAAPGDHRDEVGETGDVGGARGARPHHRRDLGAGARESRAR